MSVEVTKEKHGFKTEVKQLLNLVINSLYSNKEIFLRELISNASDAIDKFRFESIKDQSLNEDNTSLQIKVDINKSAGTITISDNGIGMSKDEVFTNLGTIAKSGTKDFLNQLSNDSSSNNSMNLIGQFGVGFYSSFMVAKKVVVNTRKGGLPANSAVKWESDGSGDFEISDTSKRLRGTEVILYLSKTDEDFANQYKVKTIVNKYSDHISWPIMMQKEKTETKTEDAEKNTKQSKPKEKEVITDNPYEQVNRATALWVMNKKSIKDEEYKELYKHISHDFEEPLTWGHNHVEGKQEYISLLYIPKRAPYNMANRDYKHGLKLYVNRVFIMDEAEQFLPQYLRFVKGIIDSSDLPLNVSREILQDNKLVESIKSATSKRVLTMLSKLFAEEEQYKIFWKEFGTILKEGIVEDHANKEKVAELMLFTTNKSDSMEPSVSLEKYLSRMPEKQKDIYYITADSYLSAKNSPHLEYYKKNNIEVVLFCDRIDDWVASHLQEFKGKKLKSVAQGEIDNTDSSEEDKTKLEKSKVEFKELIDNFKKVLTAKVKDVRISNRLVKSPACLVGDTNDMGRQMQSILKSAGQDVPPTLPILEINPEHELIKKIQAIRTENHEDWIHLIYEQAILSENGKLDNPGEFVRRMNEIMLSLYK